MPIHHVPRSAFDEAIRELSRTGEIIVSVLTNSDGRYEITTRFPSAEEQIETRTA